MATFSIDPGTHLGPVHLRVSDLDVAIPFYRDVMGLQLFDVAESQAILGVGGETPLVVLRELKGARPRMARTTGLYHYAILLPSRKDLARQLRQLIESHHALREPQTIS